jgi:hemoglobin
MTSAGDAGRRASVYEAAGGAEGLLALSHAWHQRCLADPVAAHPFEHPGHPQHSERLAAYWGEALGGPAAYTSSMGDESLVSRMHAGEGVHEELDQRTIALFDEALTDVGIVEEPLRSVLHDYFAWSTDRLSAHPVSADSVPDGLAVPHWSWDGPVG